MKRLTRLDSTHDKLVVIVWERDRDSHELWLVDGITEIIKLHDYYEEKLGYIPLFTVLKGGSHETY